LCGEDVEWIVFYPSGLRKYLFELMLRDAGDFAFLIKENRARTCSALIESKNVGHTLLVTLRPQRKVQKKMCMDIETTCAWISCARNAINFPQPDPVVRSPKLCRTFVVHDYSTNAGTKAASRVPKGYFRALHILPHFYHLCGRAYFRRVIAFTLCSGAC
jgi:hypothetical protein